MKDTRTKFTRRDFLRLSGAAGAGLATTAHALGFRAVAGRPLTPSPQSNIVVGLDIGSSKVCAAVVERLANGTIKILGIGEAPSRASKWGLHDPEGTRRSVHEALVAAEVNTDVMIGSVVLGLNAGPKGRLRNQWSTCHFLEQHELNEPFDDALCEIGMWDDIHRMADFAYMEEKALLLDLHGDRLLAQAPYAGFWNDDSLVEIEQAFISPVATAEALLSSEDKDRGALVIDMGAGTTDFTVCAGGLIQSDCVQVGSRYVAIDVPSGKVFRLRRLEKVSVEAGCVPPGKPSATGRLDGAGRKTRSWTEDFDPMRVMHTFELVKARLEVQGICLASLRAGVHLTGGYSVVPGVREFAECFLGIPAQIGRVKGILGPASVLADTRYSCALGLAKRGHFCPKSHDPMKQTHPHAMPPEEQDATPSADEERLERYLKLRENREEKEKMLLANLKGRRAELAALLESCSGYWGYEDPIYRFYHASFKVMRLRTKIEEIVAALRSLLPEQPLNEIFLQIIAEGTGRESTEDTSRAIVEAFFHARYMLEMAVRYADLEAPPEALPSGWAAFLYLFNLR